MEMLILENEWIKLVCYPSIGGKIASIWYKPLSRELLWQSQDGYKIPTYGASFSDYDKSGIDECFPMIDAEDLSWEGNTYRLPDHGELWCQPWEMKKEDQSLWGKVSGKVWNYTFERKLSLQDSTLYFEYKIQNNELFDLPGFWTFHPLFAASEAMTFEWPGCKGIELAHADAELGPQGELLSFPIGVAGNILNRIRAYSEKTTRKFFHAGKYESGTAFLHNSNLTIGLKWDPRQIPYLGVWINEGGYEKGYNIAIEPSTGYYDTIKRAMAKHTLNPIKPKEIRTFWLEMKMIDS